MHFAASYDALVPLPVFQALKAFSFAAMAFSAYSFHHQVSRLRVRPSCATYLSCLEQASLDVVPDILSGSYSFRCTYMPVEDLLEMIACLKIFKLPNFKARIELALGFWWHISNVAYKKLILQGWFLARDYFYICDKFAHGPAEKDEVYLHDYVSRLGHEMAVTAG